MGGEHFNIKWASSKVNVPFRKGAVNRSFKINILHKLPKIIFIYFNIITYMARQ